MRIPDEYRNCDLRDERGEISHVPVHREREWRALEQDAWMNRDAEAAVVKALAELLLCYVSEDRVRDAKNEAIREFREKRRREAA